jgi:hypothetical protein
MLKSTSIVKTTQYADGRRVIITGIRKPWRFSEPRNYSENFPRYLIRLRWVSIKIRREVRFLINEFNPCSSCVYSNDENELLRCAVNPLLYSSSSGCPDFELKGN